MENSKKAGILFGIVVIVFAGVYLWIDFWVLPNAQFFITYPPMNTTYTDANYTSALHLSVQTVPTVVNGITTLTGILIGFSGAIIGIVIREIPNRTRRDRTFRRYLMVVLPISVLVILILDLYGYVYLFLGGIWFTTAILYVFAGLLWASVLLIGLFISVSYRLDEQDTTPCEDNPPPTPPEPPTAQPEKVSTGVEGDGSKTVNITINMN